MAYCMFFRRINWALLAVLLCLMSNLAHADKLDDNLQTVWESLWDQRGTPRNLVRWNKALTYTINGHEADRHRTHIQKAMREAAQWTKLETTEVSTESSINDAAMLTFEVVKNDALEDTMPCVTTSKWANGALTSVVVKMQSKSAWGCTFHEVMHAMGIAGHPSGKTVLSYFPYRRDEFMPLDQLMLKAWYEPSMAKGATPLEALVILTNAVSKQTDLEISPDQALERTRAFNLRAVEQVKALALGKGEVPSIIQRSGRASTQHIDAARPLVAYFVALAYLRGTIVARDTATANNWFKVSAQYGYSAGQVMWARALIKGDGIDFDRNAAHGWLSLAAKSNNSVARTELDALETSMSPEQLDAARMAPAPTVGLK